MISYKGKGWNELVDEIRKDFLLKLPELSQDFEPPTFAVKLGWDFISTMYKEIYGKPRNTHWIEYYNLRGISPNSEQYVLPTHLIDLKQDEFNRKNGILHENLVQAAWPMIKSGERPPQSGGRRFIKNMRGSGDTDSEETVWYSAITSMFHKWYSHVSMKYMKTYNYSNPNPDIRGRRVFDKALDRYNEQGETELPTWFNMQCLNWWLNWQKISLTTNEIKRLYIGAGLARTLYDI